MIRTLLYSLKDNTIQIDVPSDTWEAKINDPQYIMWVDMAGEASQEVIHILEEVFTYHPLVIQDAIEETHIPRVDDWETFIYLTLRCISGINADDLKIETPELDVFLGANYMITYHKANLVEVDSLFNQCKSDPRYYSDGASKLLYFLAEKLVNQYADVVEDLSDTIDQIEDDIFDRAQTDTLSDIFSLKRSLLLLRRTFLPQREIFNKIARGDLPIIPGEVNIYFRDIYDHMLRMELISESLRDLISSALDTYLSVVNNRMNDVMKMLTIITTLFMPITFITGFFGMNFFQASAGFGTWTGKLMFLIILAFLILVPAGMFLWMRKRTWM